MRWGRKLQLRFRSLFHRSQVEEDLDDELNDYLQRETEREIGSGASPAEARRRAIRSLQGGEQLKEECRDARRTRGIEEIWQDLHFAIRTMRKAPAFALTMIGALALCIGANTAIFSVVDTVLFRPLPFPQQDRLVSLTEGIPSAGFPVMPFECPDYLFVSSHNRAFQSMAAFRVDSYEISGAGQSQRVKGVRMTASLLEVLGIKPVLGRSFTPKEDDTAKPLMLLNYGFARSVFAEPERALGRTIYLDRKSYTVIGVMPPSFAFPLRGLRFYNEPSEVFIPVSWTEHERKDMLDNFNYSTLARLRPNVAVPQAAANVQQLLKAMSATYPPEVVSLIKRMPNFSLQSQALPLREEITGDVQRPLLLLLAAVGIVLLIGCADAANLMFSRMVGRQREFALRAALGAQSWRLIRQMLTEGFVLSALGGAIGFCLAFWALPLLLRLAPEGLPRLNEVSLNWRVTAFVVTVVLATPILFCLAPLITVIRSAIGQQLRSGGRTSTQARYQRLIMSGTVVAQFSLAFLLLTTAGLLVRSFIKASEANPGFRPEHVLSVRIALPSTAYKDSVQVTSFFDRLLTKLSLLPSVQQTGAVSDLPMGSSSNRILSAEGRATETEKVDTIFCAGNALATLRVPLLRGRLLQPGDELRNPRVAVISESLAKRIWPQGDPIGRHIKNGVSEQEPWMTVVGVVADVKDRLTSNAPRSVMFTSREDWVNEMDVIVRASGDPLSLASAIRQEVKRLDSSLPVGKTETVDQVLEQSLSAERFRTFLLASFAIAALLLAMLGIAGLLAYNTAQRTQELGVRMALGANRRDLLWLVLSQSLRLCGTGIAIGLAASIFITRTLSALLYETSRYDPGTFIGVPCILSLVALGGSVFPAWRAVHTDPMAALKTE